MSAVFRYLKSVEGSFDYRFTMSVTQTGAEGQLFLPAMAPGTYTLLARKLQSSEASLWGSVDVTVNGEDRTDLQIFLEPASTVSGRLVFDGATPMPEGKTPFAPRVESTTTFGRSRNDAPRSRSDGTFRIDGVIPGVIDWSLPRPRLAAGRPGPRCSAAGICSTSPIEVRPGEDVSGLVVTYTDRPAAAQRHAVDTTGRPAPQFFVLVYSTNRAYWTPNSRRTRPVRAGIDGSYRISGLPPGEYFLCALTEIDRRAAVRPGATSNSSYPRRSRSRSARRGEEEPQDRSRIR